MTENEKLTISWVKSTIGSNDNIIITDKVLKTIRKKGVKRVSNKLKKYGILTFSDYENDQVFFVKEKDSRLNVEEKNGWMVGMWITDNGEINDGKNIMLLPLTPTFN